MGIMATPSAQHAGRSTGRINYADWLLAPDVFLSKGVMMSSLEQLAALVSKVVIEGDRVTLIHCFEEDHEPSCLALGWAGPDPGESLDNVIQYCIDVLTGEKPWPDCWKEMPKERSHA